MHDRLTLKQLSQYPGARICGSLALLLAMQSCSSANNNKEESTPLASTSPSAQSNRETEPKENNPNTPCADEPMTLYAQNDFPLIEGQPTPSPTNIRSGPDYQTDTLLGTIEPNVPLKAVGWEKITVPVPVPENPSGYRGRLVFVTENGGYINSAGVRSKRTDFDREGRDDTAEASSERYAKNVRPECKIIE